MAQSTLESVHVKPGESVRLNVFSEGATSYVWLRNSEIIDNANTFYYDADQPGIYSAIAYNDFDCASVESNRVELLYNKDTDPQTELQYFCEMANPTIMDLEIQQTDLIWYADSKMQRSLPASSLLKDGMIYYAGMGEGILKYAVQVQMNACLDIALHKEVDLEQAAPGALVTFTIRVKNNSAVAARNIEIREQLPDGFQYKDHQLSSGHYSSVSGIWELSDLAAHGSEEMRLRVNLVQGSSHQNTVDLIRSDPEDFVIENNSSSAAVDPICVKVYEIFSPNNDGKNDVLEISCIEQYPNNTLRVYNRDGVLVYSKRGYDNSWHGYGNSDRILTNRELLPAGVYFYILDLGNGIKTMTGWIFLAY